MLKLYNLYYELAFFKTVKNTSVNSFRMNLPYFYLLYLGITMKKPTRKQIRAVSMFIQGLLKNAKSDMHKDWISEVLLPYLLETEVPNTALYVSESKWFRSPAKDLEMVTFRTRLAHALLYAELVCMSAKADNLMECSVEHAIDLGMEVVSRFTVDAVLSDPSSDTEWEDAGAFIENADGLHWTKYIRQDKKPEGTAGFWCSEIWTLYSTFNQAIFKIRYDSYANKLIGAEVLNPMMATSVLSLLTKFFKMVYDELHFDAKSANKIIADAFETVQEKEPSEEQVDTQASGNIVSESPAVDAAGIEEGRK